MGIILLYGLFHSQVFHVKRACFISVFVSRQTSDSRSLASSLTSPLSPILHIVTCTTETQKRHPWSVKSDVRSKKKQSIAQGLARVEKLVRSDETATVCVRAQPIAFHIKHHRRGEQAVAQPYVQFEMTSGGERVTFTTHASKFPSGKNANFAERRVRTVLLPEDPLFAPQLCIRVRVDRACVTKGEVDCIVAMKRRHQHDVDDFFSVDRK